MSYRGSCHCGKVSFDVEGSIDKVHQCNCSICSKRGYLLWFVPRASMRLREPVPELPSYTFNKHVIDHHFCPTCGCAPFAEGQGKQGPMAAINVRCLEDVDLSAIEVVKVDGRSF